jgi:hypothetical protein
MGQGGVRRLTILADTAPPRLMPRLGMMRIAAGRYCLSIKKGDTLGA